MAQRRYPNWKPRLGVLSQYSDSNLAFVKSEGFTSMQLRLDPAKLDDAAIAGIKDKISKAGLVVSSLACDGNHIDPDPANREKQNKYAASCIELAGKLGIPGIGGQSGTMRGRPLPVQAARDFADKIYDVHLKDTEILWHQLRRGGINPVNNQRWWRFRIPGQGSVDWKGFFAVLAEVGYQGAMNIENEDEFYYPAYDRDQNFTEQYKRGFKTAHEFLKTLVPPVG